MFKVVPDQLRLSQGWVRCGQCDEVFDANAHMYMDPLAPASEADGDTEGPSTLATADSRIDADDAQPHQNAPAPDEGAAQPPLPAIAEEPPELAELADAAAQQVTDVASRDVEPADLAGKLSFMRGRRPHPVWGRPLVRAGLALLTLVLVLALVLQVAVQERDRIAAYQPDARIALESLCNALDCTVQPLRQIESVVIDSSSFARVRADTHRLHATLRNNAAVEVAMPSLELTLTDMQERVLVRRVLQPQEWGSTQVAMAAGAEVTVSLPVNLKFLGNAERNSGYRLLAFYP
jgi:predicted Zn finger-like uncharacterized protein